MTFLIFSTPIFTMDVPPKPKKKKLRQRLTTYLTHQHPHKPISFTNVPTNIQQYIISLFPIMTDLTNISDAGRVINALARTNKTLNQLLNEPACSLNIMKSLSHRFNIDNETICECMQTKETKRLLLLQRRLRNICINPRTPLKNFIQVRLQGSTDLDFTYKKGMTLLLFCIDTSDFCTLGYLLQKGAHPNICSPGGTTPLIESIIFNYEHVVHLLLAAGADPELYDSSGIMSPYAAAGWKGSEKLMRLIASHIDKKRATSRTFFGIHDNR